LKIPKWASNTRFNARGINHRAGWLLQRHRNQATERQRIAYFRGTSSACRRNRARNGPSPVGTSAAKKFSHSRGRRYLGSLSFCAMRFEQAGGKVPALRFYDVARSESGTRFRKPGIRLRQDHNAGITTSSMDHGGEVARGWISR
jgi:hypothetical protein